jgi:hypothetical protein
MLGTVLPHDVDVRIGSEFGNGPANESIGACCIFRQNQVTNQQPAIRTAADHSERSRLSVHFPDCCGGVAQAGAAQ